MSPSANDLVRKAAPNFQTTLASSMLSSDTSATLTSVTGLPTGTGVTITIDAVDASGNPTPTLKETMTGVVSGTSIANLLRGLDGTTQQAHGSGAVVVQWFTANDWNDFQTAFTNQHSQLDGSHTAITATSVSSTGNINSSGGKIQESGNALIPAGIIQMYAASSTPLGWLLCDGSAISRTGYATLFAAIGTTYGTGDGSTTFNLPNLKGNVPVGYNASDSNFNSLGKTGGESTHTLSNSEMPVHNHSGATANANMGGTLAYRDYNGAGSSTAFSYLTQSNVANRIDQHTHNIPNDGGGGAHNNLQPYLVVNYIIKT